MNKDDAALLLLDHQTGLFQTVKDITIAELRANVSALVRIGTLLKLPIITTASVPDGPNGPRHAGNCQASPAGRLRAAPRRGECMGQ
jgi:hypothetical protein